METINKSRVSQVQVKTAFVRNPSQAPLLFIRIIEFSAQTTRFFETR